MWIFSHSFLKKKKKRTGTSVQTYIKTHTYHGNAKSNRVCAWLHVTCNSDTVMEGRGRVQPWILAMEKQKQWVSYKVQARLVRGVHSNILSQKWTKKSVWPLCHRADSTACRPEVTIIHYSLLWVLRTEKTGEQHLTAGVCLQPWESWQA